MSERNTIDAYGLIALADKVYRLAVAILGKLQSVLLLVIRLYWGWQFFLTGRGKLMNLGRTANFFESLHIPFPHFQAALVASLECGGGLLLLMGLASRLISIPLAISLTVAYFTADFDRVQSIFSDPDKFLMADEFLFLFAVILVLCFGPGVFSIDHMIRTWVRRRVEGNKANPKGI